MAKRSSYYSASKHGTGWQKNHPSDAEVRFLDQTSVTNNDKVKYMVNNGVTPPTALASAVASVTTTVITPIITTTKQEIEAGIGGVVTSHYIINYSKTGFPIRLIKLNYPKIEITIA